MSEIDPKATLAELRLAQINREALERAHSAGASIASSRRPSLRRWQRLPEPTCRESR